MVPNFSQTIRSIRGSMASILPRKHTWTCKIPSLCMAMPIQVNLIFVRQSLWSPFLQSLHESLRSTSPSICKWSPDMHRWSIKGFHTCSKLTNYSLEKSLVSMYCMMTYLVKLLVQSTLKIAKSLSSHTHCLVWYEVRLPRCITNGRTILEQIEIHL